ncbi:phosphatidylglycerol lysyltransferase [Lactococcus hodotermopsidis]|uniref:Phosphatidylglycerol lysyltransferase n=1 Tax=Pseudolactococcus hodotermopsidis TaxID=2709157 RepID=A0A6A0BCD0_9LACT|nr:bifunctional lysylphosphatidylglycerol flippase/synthetase MprF [Lactococcus hodotermopsidis]GFH42018.1 phosphatidylglycerol lysyltransferase [Lactococcus hodotermopsidis]
MIKWFKERIKYFKYIFIMAAVVLVMTELFTISKHLSGQQLRQIFSDMPLWQPFVIILLGLLAILPMIGYDLVLNRLIDNQPKKRFLFETSWLINTINNLIGFGGIFTIGFRSSIYGKGKDNKKVLSTISQIFLFSGAGLSIFSLISLILSLNGQLNHFVSQYWIWFLGGTCYFPIVLIATSVKKDGFLGGVDLKNKLLLLVISTLEWLGVLLSFCVTGVLLGVKVSSLEISALFVAAMIIGVVSMIPGALGSFDVMMFLGLSHLGIDSEIIGAWILLFRVAYYFVPFIIGVIFAVKNLGGSFNAKYHDVPRHLIDEIGHKIAYYLLYLSGILLVLSATVPEFFSSLKWLSKISPWSEHIVAEFPKVVLGFLLIAMGRALANKVERAFLPTLILEIIVLIYIIWDDFSWYGILFYLLVLLLTVVTKSQLYRKQLVFSLESLVRDGFMYFVLITIYLGIGVYNSPISIFHPHKKMVHEFLLFPSFRVWLTGFIAIVAVIALDYALIHYLKGTKETVGEKADYARIAKVLTTYGGNTESQLVYLGDKDMFMYQNQAGEDTVFLQFEAYHDKVVVMGEPSGKRIDFKDALACFVKTCDLYGYSPVFYEVMEQETLALHEYGYNFIKVGEEAHVHLADFTLEGKKHKNHRAIVNRFERDGYRLEMLETPFSKEVLAEMRLISDEWLNGRKEMGFSLGYFDEAYISRAPIAVVKNNDEKIVAFATIMHSYTQEVVTIDLMRYSSEAPSGVMDFLFLSLFAHLREAGFAEFDLGMAPLSNVGIYQQSNTYERVANLIYQFGNKIYSFQGLRSYKDKYADAWIPRYIAYPKTNYILFVILALLMINNKPVELENDSL